MNTDNKKYKISVEFELKPEIPVEKIKKIFRLDDLVGLCHTTPSSWKGNFKIHEKMLYAAVEGGKSSWVFKTYNLVYDSIPDLIKKVKELPTKNLVITVYDTKTLIMELVLARKSNSYWEVSNGYRGMVFERGLIGPSKSEIAKKLKDYISES